MSFPCVLGCHSTCRACASLLLRMSLSTGLVGDQAGQTSCPLVGCGFKGVSPVCLPPALAHTIPASFSRAEPGSGRAWKRGSLEAGLEEEEENLGGRCNLLQEILTPSRSLHQALKSTPPNHTLCGVGGGCAQVIPEGRQRMRPQEPKGSHDPF